MTAPVVQSVMTCSCDLCALFRGRQRRRCAGSSLARWLLHSMSSGLWSEALLVLLLAVGSSLGGHCEPWCVNACDELNGNIEDECGGCDPEDPRYVCHAQASGYADWRESASKGARPASGAALDAATASSQVQPSAIASESAPAESAKTERPQFVAGPSARLPHSSVPLDESANLSSREAIPCQRLTADAVSAMDVSRRAEVLSRPTLISGLIEDWPALHEWTDAGAFAAAFADHGVLAKRLSPWREATMRHGVDPESTLVPMRDALWRSDQVHVVLYNGEVSLAGGVLMAPD